MSPQQHFRAYVEWAGGPVDAKTRLGMSLAQVYNLMAGRRTITVETAEKVENDSDGRFPRDKLIWGDDDLQEARSS